MFEKSGDKKGSPQKMGRNGQNNGAEVLKFYLELPEMKGRPIYPLEDSLSVGSEEGEVIIDHESVAPNHCSINLNQDILSIIDHGSKTGTKINRRAIPPGKMIILNLKDKIEIGSVKAQITSKKESVPTSPPPFQYDKTGTKEVKNIGLEIEPPDVPLPTEEKERAKEHTLVLPDTPRPKERAQKYDPKKAKKKAKKKKAIVMASKEASNGFLRVMGLICDALIIGVVHTLLSSEQAYRHFLRDLPRFAQDLTGPLYNDFLKEPLNNLMQAAPELEGAIEMIKTATSGNLSFLLQLALLLGLYRLVTSFVLGVSLGQFLVGIRASGSPLVKRLLAPVRWCLGLILLPIFWITDFPALFSKRTFKEVFSFTRLETPSTIMAILSMLIFLPLLIAAFLVGPALKGMQIPEPQVFVPMKKVELGVYDMGSIDSDSSYFSIGVPSSQVDYVLPKFRFSQKGGRKSLNPSLALGKGEEKLELKLLRKVSLVNLFRKFTSLNPMAEMKYPVITSFVNNSVINSSSVKAPPYAPIPIAMETQNLLEASLSLTPTGLNQISNFLTSNGPFVGAFIEFRKALNSFMGEGAQSLRLRQLGNSIVIEADYSIARKVIKRYLPLNRSEAKLYEVTYNKGKKPAFIDFLAWNIKADQKEDAIALMSFVDNLLPGKKSNVTEVFQKTNETYYELGKTALLEDNIELYRDLQMSIQGALQVLMENSQSLGLPEKASQKMAQNLNDLLKALKDKDLEYFGVRSVGVANE